MTTEQRKYPRYSVEVAAEVQLRGEVTVASTKDLSNGGASLITERPLPEGTPIAVTLFLTQDGIEDPDEEPFEAQATVMWSAERDSGSYTTGVRFDRIQPSQDKQLQRFLTALKR
jgi:c-di-GMP-binding flagellar brake protein YcgR